MKRWRNGLAVASVIWWHNRPLWAFPRMRSDARGYPWWPGTQTFRSRAGYRSARPTTSRSSLSACNARPVHTDGPTSDMIRPQWLRSQGILVYASIFHNYLEVLGRVGDQVDILQRIAVDQQQIGKRALFHDAELARIRTTFAGQCQQFGVGSGRHAERFGWTVPADKRGENCPLLLR